MYRDEQPKGLYLLFFTELWERFGFYTLQAVLVLYISTNFGFTDARTYSVTALFNAMIYITPVIGGMLADKILGFKQSVIIGAVLFIIGYAIIGVPSRSFFYSGMSFVIVANGLLKPSICSIVGSLYSFEDKRRDGGFTLFYMGINLGSLFPPLIVGTVVMGLGWYAGFVMAAFGMAVGLANFVRGRTLLEGAGDPPRNSPLYEEGAARFNTNLVFYIGLVAALIFFRFIFDFAELATILVMIFAAIVFILACVRVCREPEGAKERAVGMLILVLLSIGFWTLYAQQFTSLMLFADRNVDLYFLGYELRPEFLQFFNPLFIVLLAPLTSHWWCKTDGTERGLSIPSKFCIGLFLYGFGYLALGWMTQLATGAGILSIWYVVIAILIFSAGELFVTPIALSMITRLSPKSFVGTMIGVWFVMQAGGIIIGGHLARFAEVSPGVSTEGSIMSYRDAFTLFGYFGLVLSLIGIILIPLVKRFMHIKDETE